MQRLKIQLMHPPCQMLGGRHHVFVRKIGRVPQDDIDFVFVVNSASPGVLNMNFERRSPGSMLATVAYMSPEQGRANELDAAPTCFLSALCSTEMSTILMEIVIRSACAHWERRTPRASDLDTPAPITTLR